MVLFWPFAVRLIVSLGPFATRDRLAGELLERLAGEVLTCPPHDGPIGLTAGDMDRSDATFALDLKRGLVAFPARTEGGDEAGDSSAARSGERSEDGVSG